MLVLATLYTIFLEGKPSTGTEENLALCIKAEAMASRYTSSSYKQK